MRILAVRVSVVAGLLLLVFGCAKSPPPTFYMLATAEPERSALGKAGVAIGVGPVQLPPHLDRHQIVSRVTPTRLYLSEKHHWAEPLSAGFLRVLITNLGWELGSNHVYALPVRRHRNLQYQVAVDVFRLDGELGKNVVLRARWTLMDGDGRRILHSGLTQIEQATERPDHAGLVAALSHSVVRLAQEIGVAIRDVQASRDG